VISLFATTALQVGLLGVAVVGFWITIREGAGYLRWAGRNEPRSSRLGMIADGYQPCAGTPADPLLEEDRPPGGVIIPVWVCSRCGRTWIVKTPPASHLPPWNVVCGGPVVEFKPLWGSEEGRK